jgi:hypothetical protein
MALDPAPLTWLESLNNNSIDSWEGLKKVFIDNFQGAITRAGTHHDLTHVNWNARSSYDHTHAISSTYEPPLRTSQKRTSSTQASIETLGGTDQKLL